VVGDRPLAGVESEGSQTCAALAAELTAPAGKTIEYWILLGEGEDRREAEQFVDAHRSRESIDAAYAEATGFWTDLFDGFSIDTPSQPLNLMVNGWLPYQNLACRIWGRSAYYQSGGAYGYRDQLQDSSAFTLLSPEITRRQILRHAERQFVEGDVLHWWHPPVGAGIRTRFSDDLLWLPLLTAEYAEATGDQQIWRETRPYLQAPLLEPGQAERFLIPENSDERGDVYEHCCRAIDRSLDVGAHGLPLMGTGDWNDGMNRIGQGGKGESVWMGFFLSTILQKFIPVCRRFEDHDRANRYEQHRLQLESALNEGGWDGQWYRRAYYDDGAPVGSARSEECQIDALAQAWAVLSGAAPADRAEMAVQSVLERLVSTEERMIKLLDPPFHRCAHDPGYIKGYLPGVRENGGQYTHGVLWFVRALGEMGRGTLACELLEMLTPVRHGDSPEMVAKYQAEPYVVAADVYGVEPHVGRAGWTWYTGSAGWMVRVATETLLGLKLDQGERLRIAPAIAADWPHCRVSYRLDDGRTRYEISIANPHRREDGVTSATLDGQPIEVVDGGGNVPLLRDGQLHTVEITL
ncbi:MAG: cyclic beta 1-2 glucan synthetase, partial [Planctomycetales bacterium]|nr:cyclic beta 1-2 glucan synthetase [Planctomycetales bacterium]